MASIASVIREKIREAAEAYDPYFQTPKIVVSTCGLGMRILSSSTFASPYLKFPLEIHLNLRRIMALTGKVKILNNLLNGRFTWKHFVINVLGIFNFVAIAVRLAEDRTPSSIVKQMKKLFSLFPLLSLCTYKYWRKGPKGKKVNHLSNALFLGSNLLRIAQRLNLLVEMISGYTIDRPSPAIRWVLSVARRSCEVGYECLKR